MCYVQCIFKDQEFISAVILWVETCMGTEWRVLCCGRRGWIIWLGTTRSIAVQQSGEVNSSSSWYPATIPMLLQGALETPLAGPNTGATRRGCEHLSEELLTPMTLRSPPPASFSLALSGTFSDWTYCCEHSAWLQQGLSFEKSMQWVSAAP